MALGAVRQAPPGTRITGQSRLEHELCAQLVVSVSASQRYDRSTSFPASALT
jgi:hypothetical protein